MTDRETVASDALREAGYSEPQIKRMLDAATGDYIMARQVVTVQEMLVSGIHRPVQGVFRELAAAVAVEALEKGWIDLEMRREDLTVVYEARLYGPRRPRD